MRVALHSVPSRLGDRVGNVQTVADALSESRADLHVFPEMFLTGYNIGDDVQRLALTSLDERLMPLCDAAQETSSHLIVGAPWTPRPGITHNAALCIDDAGSLFWVPKRRLPTFTTFREGLFFAPGARQDVWQTRFGNIGVGICYDLFFPELHRKQVLEGADILVNISASPTTSARFFRSLLVARAIENACFMLYSNNVGAQDGLMFWGGSRAIGPRGDELAALAPLEDGIATADLDMSDLVPAREFRPTIRDADPVALAALGD